MPDLIHLPKGKPRNVKTIVTLDDGSKVPIYAGTAILEALRIVSMDMDIYKGVRLSQLLTALYEQGKKDGARDVFDKVDVLKDEHRHRNPGRPKKKKKPAKKK